MTRNSTARSGFTLVEVLVSVTVLTLILVAGMTYMSTQTRAFASSVERTTALTRTRYVAQTLQRELRSLGTGLVSGQAGLLYAGADVVAFNADFASNVAGDMFAVYVDPDAPDDQVLAPTSTLTVPQTAFTYGTVTYQTTAGSTAPAELLTFFFVPDSVSAEPDDFVLYRQANRAAPEPVSDGIRRLDGQPFFQYWTGAAEESAGGTFQAIADSTLPIAHSEPFHLSPADSATSAVVDSVRAIAVRFEVWTRPDTSGMRPLRVDRMIALPNAGVRPVTSCGSAPLLGVALTSAAVTLASGEPAVELSWDAAVDEAGGEGDVVRYVLWRRTLPDTEWGNPLLSIPAGAPSYAYTDATIQSGSTYEYGLAAQDCTPTMSAMIAGGVIVIP
jgi:prepilin-type N-terminal cleavage/methylation domain-containing protein